MLMVLNTDDPLGCSITCAVTRAPCFGKSNPLPLNAASRKNALPTTGLSDQWNIAIKPAMQISGPFGCRQHDLRMTLTTGMQKLGASREVVKSLLNHSENTIEDVTSVYARYNYFDEKRDALERWEEHIKLLTRRS